jgi:hypothetical protein
VDVASDLFLFQYTYGDAAGFASGELIDLLIIVVVVVVAILPTCMLEKKIHSHGVCIVF